MEMHRYIGIELSSSKKAMERVLEGLTQAEAAWQPASGCNCIGLILFHVARAEDSMIQGLLQKTASIWESGKWYETLGLPKEEEGSHYTVDQVDAFKVPELSGILEYYDAVRARTKEILRGMPVDALDENITFPHYGDMPKATLFSFVAAHASQHTGEVSYLRGMQRGLDK